jgi:nitrate reductase delta subunit
MRQSVYRLFADLLEYPTSADLAERARACADLLDPAAAALLNEFRAFVEQSPPERLEELYTNTFDLQVVCYPYVGYHLFGESYKRGAFLARLNEGYQARGFSSGKELPDHLGVVLRFLARGEGGEFGQTLLDEGLIPAVNAMVGTFGDEHSQSTSTEHSRSNGGNPYSKVLRALLLVLQERQEGTIAA